MAKGDCSNEKRILSTLLALGLLPTAALAVGNSYGPDDEGWGYVTSEKVIDLGEIEYDGTEKAKCGSFTITIENTSAQTLISEAFQSIGNGLRYSAPAFSIRPGESRDISFTYTVPAGMEYTEYQDYFYINFEGLDFAGKPVEDIIQFLPQFTLVEAGSGSGSSASGDAGTLSPRAAKSQYGISISPSHIDFGSCFVGDTVEPITITVTNNGSHTVDLDYRGGLKSDVSAVSFSGYYDMVAPANRNCAFGPVHG